MKKDKIVRPYTQERKPDKGIAVGDRLGSSVYLGRVNRIPRKYRPRVQSLGSKVSDASLDFLMLQIFDRDSVYIETADVLGAAMARTWRKRKLRQHWLCEILWKAAETISGESLGEVTHDAVFTILREAGLPRFLAKIIARGASKLVDSSIPLSAKQVADFLKVIVLLICPEPDRCEYGNEALEFLIAPGIELALRSGLAND